MASDLEQASRNLNIASTLVLMTIIMMIADIIGIIHPAIIIIAAIIGIIFYNYIRRTNK